MKAIARSAVALRHLAFEDLGLLGPILEAEGWSISIVDAPTADLSDPRLTDADLLIALGGPIGIYEIDAYPFLSPEIRLLERRLSRGAPTLGICLGCQAMAKALGANVYPGGVKEIGWGAVNLTGDGRRSALAPLGESGAEVLHWHGDTFDLPSGAALLASNESYPHQAFSFGAHQLALQFHIEVDPRLLELWLVGHAAELAQAGVSPIGLRAAARQRASSALRLSHAIFASWIRSLPGRTPSS